MQVAVPCEVYLIVRHMNSAVLFAYLLSLVVQLDEHTAGQKVSGEVQQIRVVEEYEKLAQLSRHGPGGGRRGARSATDTAFDGSRSRRDGYAVTDYAPCRGHEIFPIASMSARMTPCHTLDHTSSTPITLRTLPFLCLRRVRGDLTRPGGVFSNGLPRPRSRLSSFPSVGPGMLRAPKRDETAATTGKRR